MDKFKECVTALKDVRRSMQNDVDPCVLAALDNAIAELECCRTNDLDQQSTVKAVSAALGVLSDVVACATGIAELMKILGA